MPPLGELLLPLEFSEVSMYVYNIHIFTPYTLETPSLPPNHISVCSPVQYTTHLVFCVQSCTIHHTFGIRYICGPVGNAIS